MKLSPLVHPSPVGPSFQARWATEGLRVLGQLLQEAFVLANKESSRRSSHLLDAYRVWCGCYGFLRVGVCLKWPALLPTSVLDMPGVQLEPAS